MAKISIVTIITFIATTIATLGLFHLAIKNKKVLLGIIIWTLIVSILGISGFYQVENQLPPRFTLLLGPGILFVIIVFVSKKSKQFDLKWMTLLHTIRIPVELVLYSVYLEGLIPDLMTFDRYNYDILSGISAPIIYYAVFHKKWMGYKGLLIWNFICLGLLINILTIAVLSAQTPIQKLAFDQPNIGVTYFPLVWLPAVIVPIVLFSHLMSIKQLMFVIKNKTTNNQ